MNANQSLAVVLCRAIEAVAPEFGCHVALTGGCLYKDGDRKDIDLIFYRIRQVDEINRAGLIPALCKLGIVFPLDIVSSNWCIKANWHGINIDCLFPEAKGSKPEGY